MKVLKEDSEHYLDLLHTNYYQRLLRFKQELREHLAQEEEALTNGVANHQLRQKELYYQTQLCRLEYFHRKQVHVTMVDIENESFSLELKNLRQKHPLMRESMAKELETEHKHLGEFFNKKNQKKKSN